MEGVVDRTRLTLACGIFVFPRKSEPGVLTRGQSRLRSRPTPTVWFMLQTHTWRPLANVLDVTVVKLTNSRFGMESNLSCPAV